MCDKPIPLGKQPVFPCIFAPDAIDTPMGYHATGIRMREFIAALCMAALIGNGHTRINGKCVDLCDEGSVDILAWGACESADALLAELEKK